MNFYIKCFTHVLNSIFIAAFLVEFFLTVFIPWDFSFDSNFFIRFVFPLFSFDWNFHLWLKLIFYSMYFLFGKLFPLIKIFFLSMNFFTAILKANKFFHPLLIQIFMSFPSFSFDSIFFFHSTFFLLIVSLQAV